MRDLWGSPAISAPPKAPPLPPSPVETEKCALPPEDDLPQGRHGEGRVPSPVLVLGERRCLCPSGV